MSWYTKCVCSHLVKTAELPAWFIKLWRYGVITPAIALSLPAAAMWADHLGYGPREFLQLLRTHNNNPHEVREVLKKQIQRRNPTSTPTTKPTTAPTTNPTTNPTTDPTHSPLPPKPATPPAPQITPQKPADSKPAAPASPAPANKEAVFVARVLFSETRTCSSQERAKVAGVMHNRVHNPAFDRGRIGSMYAAASQPGAYSSVNDNSNTNWAATATPESFTGQDKAIWDECLRLATNPPAAVSSNGKPLVYYHDLSIDEPANWNNRFYTTQHEDADDSDHFKFYSIVPAQ